MDCRPGGPKAFPPIHRKDVGLDEMREFAGCGTPIALTRCVGLNAPPARREPKPIYKGGNAT